MIRSGAWRLEVFPYWVGSGNRLVSTAREAVKFTTHEAAEQAADEARTWVGMPVYVERDSRAPLACVDEALRAWHDRPGEDGNLVCMEQGGVS